MAKTLHGDRAVQEVARNEGRPLSYCERRTVWLEGYVDGTYLDTKGILTGYVGQTGEWIDQPFSASFQHHVDRAAGRIPNLRALPEFLQAELIQAEYRGDLGLSPTAVGHMNAIRWAKAADEFLNNNEYRNPATPPGIKRRMKAVSFACLLYSVQ